MTFHGAVPYRDAGALYSRARVLVNTSDVEGFPNTYLQAWASGTPVVAFSIRMESSRAKDSARQCGMRMRCARPCGN